SGHHKNGPPATGKSRTKPSDKESIAQVATGCYAIFLAGRSGRIGSNQVGSGQGGLGWTASRIAPIRGPRRGSRAGVASPTRCHAPALAFFVIVTACSPRVPARTRRAPRDPIRPDPTRLDPIRPDPTRK